MTGVVNKKRIARNNMQRQTKFYNHIRHWKQTWIIYHSPLHDTISQNNNTVNCLTKRRSRSCNNMDFEKDIRMRQDNGNLTTSLPNFLNEFSEETCTDTPSKSKFYNASPSESVDSGIYMESWPNEDYVQLANGWVRCEDEQGYYYWHKNTGTVTRQNPQTVKLCEMTTSSQRFAVNALGWKRIPEDELTMENSSRAVNRCIYELSHGVKDFNETVARWGEGKTLIMEIDDENMILRDPAGLISLHRQPINSIKVWGVGRENNRDFAYVAKNRWNNQYTCHVFRCEDVCARSIANAIRDSCTRMLSRNGTCENGRSYRSKSVLFPNETSEGENVMRNFPARANEPTKSLLCKYVGNTKVDSAKGIATIQKGIEELIEKFPETSWTKSRITISPSAIIVKKEVENGETLLEGRIRYVSFIGIGKDIRLCGIIIHEADSKFYCHVIHSEPSAGLLCKTIEAACKLRYQKCIDAHPQAINISTKNRSHSMALTKVGDKFRSIIDNALDYWMNK